MTAQGLAYFSYKGLDSKYFWFCRSDSLCHNRLLEYPTKATTAIHKYMSMAVCDKTLFIKISGRPDLAHQHSLWNPDLDE